MKEKIAFWAWIIVAFCLLSSGLIFLIWKVVVSLDAEMLLKWGVFSAYAVLVMLVLIPAGIGVGYYFGRTEARGWLAGADQVMDKTLGRMIDLSSRVSKEAKPSQTVVLFPEGKMPQLSTRANSEDVIDI